MRVLRLYCLKLTAKLFLILICLYNAYKLQEPGEADQKDEEAIESQGMFD